MSILSKHISLSGLVLCSLFSINIQAQNFSNSNLPILIIETSGQEIVDEPKINVDLKIIYNGPGQRNNLSDQDYHYDGIAGVEYRGATSQFLFEKKGLALETRKDDFSNNNVSLLGLPEENDWVLHGPYSDKTLIRNALAYQLAEEIMDYAPRTRFVELIINGEYRGVYLFTEKIKRDKNRVDLAKLNDSEIEGLDLTGGYILKIDKTEGAGNDGFVSDYPAQEGRWQETFYQFHYPKPDEIEPEQAEYIRDYIADIDEVFQQEDYNDLLSGYSQHIDIISAIDYLFVNELSKNPDAYRLSSYMYKDRDDIDPKLHFGPVWDYNLGFGNVNYCTNGDFTGFVVNRFNQVCPDDFWIINYWWEKMIADSTFQNLAYERWFDLRETVLSTDKVLARIDSLALTLDEAQVRNFSKFPTLSQWIWPNYTVENSYGGEINRLKYWVTNRLEWIDNNIDQIYIPPFDYSIQYDPRIIPNPIQDHSVLRHYSHMGAQGLFQIIDAQGQFYYKSELRNEISGFNEISLPDNMPTGLYFYSLTINESHHSGSFFVNQ